MAKGKGLHQRGGESQQDTGREAYEQAYQRYIQEQAAANRGVRGQGAQGPAGYRQPPRQQGPYQRGDYRQQAAGQRAVGYVSAQPAGAYGQYNAQGWNSVPKKKGHPVRNTIIVLLLLILILGGFAGFTGYRLYNSAKTVRADASVVMDEISDLKDQILSENPTQANATASDIAKRAKAMKEETSRWEWTVGSYVPVYGGDVNKVRELAGVFDELATQAIVPLVSEVSQVSIKNLLVDGAINVDLAKRMVEAVDKAAPIIDTAARKLDTMGKAELEQVNGPLEKARDRLASLNTATSFVASIAPTFSDMVGADGRPRTYVIIAQSNVEIRSTGGFIGSVGPLYLDNGRIELGDFRGVYDIYPNDPAPLTDEEYNIFGRHVGWQIADCNFIPDFSRVGEIVKFAWEEKGYGGVDAVIGVDPVFLQKMLSIAGPVTTSNGTVVDGSNAARLLLHDVYYWETELQDPFFEEVAALAFKQLMSHLGDISITDLAKVLKEEMDARRLQVWMNAENEEAAIETIGADGKLSHDETKPTLGVYFDDESYSKLFWYMKADTSVGDGVKNADGTTTYPVTVAYHNMLQDENELSDYMKAHNGVARSKGDMIAWVMLSAPQGGFISDVVCTEGDFMPEGTKYREEGSYVSGTMTQTTLQGLDFWYGLTRTLPGNTFSLSFNVTVPATATEPLKVIRTATAQEVAGW